MTQQEQFYATLNSALTSDTAQRIANRLELLSRSAGLPESGYGDVKAVAAHLGLSEDGAYALLKRFPSLPRSRPGTSVLFRFADLAALATEGGAK